MPSISSNCNCVKPDTCPRPSENYDCCRQKTPSGDNFYGLWTKKDQCNKNTGLPYPGIKESLTLETEQRSENFTIRGSKENYKNRTEKDCSNWQRAFHVLFLVILLVVILLLMKRRHIL
jgi:hypothetical protein